MGVFHRIDCQKKYGKHQVLYFLLILSLFFHRISYAQTSDFMADTTTGCIPMQVSFTDLSTGNPIAWEWDMGDGSSYIYKQNPTYIYQHQGTYSVTLRVTYADSSVQSKTINNYITASTGPYVNFSSSNSAVCQYQNIVFYDTILPGGANVKNLLWDFGDGGTSTQNQPTYQYHNAGTYKVSLTAYNQMGCATKTEKPSFITIYANPTADFVADSVFCIQNVSETKHITFSNNSSNYTNSLWIFGDGTTSSSNAPSKSFGSGNHDVTLIVTSDKGCKDTLTKSNYISIHIFKADFTVSDSIICSTSKEITFYGLHGINYIWAYGDGFSGIGSKANHTYTQAGKYTVSLYATSILGCKDTVIKTNYVTIYDSVTPTISIYDTLHCDTNARINFINQTVYPSSDDFGLEQTIWDVKGDSSHLITGDSVNYVYGHYGEWICRAFITTPYGCKLPPVEQKILITPFMVASDIDSFPGGCAPMKIEATVREIGKYAYKSPIENYVWIWSNNDTSITSNPSINHTYYDTGVFNIRTIVTNKQGCIAETTTSIVLGAKPLCSWTSTPTKECKSQFSMPVYAYDSLDSNNNLIGDASANNWIWFHNGKIISTLINNNNNYLTFNKDTGAVTSATLVCYHYYCPSDSITKPIDAYVCPPIAYVDSLARPYLSEKHNPYRHPYCNSMPRLPDSINRSVAANLFRWNFGNDYDSTAIGGSDFKGDTSSLKNPVYQYKYGPYLKKKNGDIYVSMVAVNDSTTIYNACGYCEDTITFLIRISVADMRLRVTDEDSVLIDEICQDNIVYFWDSTNCTSQLTTWGLRIVDSLNPSFYLLDTVIINTINTYDSTHNKDVSIRTPMPFYFPDYGVYYAYLYNADTIACGRYKDEDTADAMVMEKYYDFNDLRLDTLRIPVYPRSVPDCYVPSPICVNDTVRFTNLSYTPSPFNNLSIEKYFWTSAGKTDTTISPQFVYENGGRYDVSLRIINEKGCDSTQVLLDKITVHDIRAYFSKSASTICNKETVIFRNLSGSMPSLSLSYLWDFNGEDTAITRDAQYTFNVDKSKWVYITLTVYDNDIGCIDIHRDSIYVRCIHADFNANENYAACPELQAYFYDQSIADSIVSWEWNFGDTISVANTSKLQNPSHNYAFAGNYSVQLIIIDDIGCTDTIVKNNYIKINGPYGYFNVTPKSGCYPLTVNFSCNFINVDTLIIITGDGSTLVSTDTTKEFNYTYQNPGPYIPSMRLIKWVNDSLSGQLVRCVQNFVYYDTIWAIKITPDFLADSIYCQNLPISFKNLTDTIHANIYPPSLFNECLFYWHYGKEDWDSLSFDGSTTYDTAGMFDISLKVIVRGCTATLVKPINIFDFPNIILSTIDTSSCDSALVEFSADSLSGLETSLDWSFHDGQFAKGNPIKYLYTSTGVYPYSLTLTFFNPQCIKKYDDSVSVFVWLSPIADFTIQNQEGANITDRDDIGIKAQESAIFIDQSQFFDGQITRWIWNYGDSICDTLFKATPTLHAYTTTSGIVNVTLNIEDEYGCKSFIEHFLLILEVLRFPNVFTPNNDGINDYFQPIEVVGFFIDFELIIYNKWGNKVWERRCSGDNCPDYNNNNFWWDGKMKNGKEASEGVYYWVVSAKPKSQTTTFILNGSVSLMR